MAGFEQELATYGRELAKLRLETGKFALIKGEHVIGTFDSYADALKSGYEHFKLDPFLVKKIEAVERVLHFTRYVEPACP